MNYDNDQRRPPRKNCGNCHFSAPMPENGNPGADVNPTSGSAKLFCNRFPPVPIVLHGKLSAKGPTVHPRHWCGEWQAK